MAQKEGPEIKMMGAIWPDMMQITIIDSEDPSEKADYREQDMNESLRMKSCVMEVEDRLPRHHQVEKKKRGPYRSHHSKLL